MGEILCITGRSGTGKSTLARHLSNELHIDSFSLGDYQRQTFSRYGSPLQYHARLGLDVTYYGQWSDYISEISKRRTKNGIIVEGVYTYEFLNRLRDSFRDDNIHLLRVWAPKKDRIRFFSMKTNKNGDAAAELIRLDRIKMHVGLHILLKHAELTLRNDSDLNTFLRNGLDMAKCLFDS